MTGRLYTKFLFILLFFLVSSVLFGQSYIGWVTKTASLHEGSNAIDRILKTLSAGSPVFVFSATGENNFCKVIDIESDTYGYVSKSSIQLHEVIPEGSEGKNPFERTRSVGINPQIEITNSANIRLTLTLNEERYTIGPHETKSITITPGRYRYIVSAAGALPSVGNNTFESQYKYTWFFYTQ